MVSRSSRFGYGFSIKYRNLVGDSGIFVLRGSGIEGGSITTGQKIPNFQNSKRVFQSKYSCMVVFVRTAACVYTYPVSVSFYVL